MRRDFIQRCPIYDFNKEEEFDCGFRQDIRNLLKELLDRFPYLGIEIFPGGDNVYLLRENEETEKHSKKKDSNLW